MLNLLLKFDQAERSAGLKVEILCKMKKDNHSSMQHL